MFKNFESKFKIEGKKGLPFFNKLFKIVWELYFLGTEDTTFNIPTISYKKLFIPPNSL